MFFFSHTTSCILQRHHSLALNKIISLSLKLSQSLLVFSQEHALLILYFLHYVVIENDEIFQKRDIYYEYNAVMIFS